MTPLVELAVVGVTDHSAAIVVFASGVFVGLCAPTYYATERLRGFARAMLAKLPYKPPPGKDGEEALAEASDE